MKNKLFTRLISVLLAVGLSVSMFTTTAFAGGGDEEGEVLPVEPSGEVEPTPPPEPKPLTPESNMSLVDDIDGEASEDKQFTPSFPRTATTSTSSSTGPRTARTQCIFPIRWTRTICWP